MNRPQNNNNQRTQLEVNNLYIKIYENGPNVQSLSLTRKPDEGIEQAHSHWLGPLLHKRFREPISVPWERLHLDHLTTFQRSVLRALDEIPAGSTISYGEMSRRINRPGAARAVGQALKQNPYPLLLPCHRVIRSNGQPGGFGGKDNTNLKPHLLSLEGALTGRS